ELATAYQQANFGRQVFNNGTLVPFGVAFVQETTVFREFGPLAGNTMRLAFDIAPKIGNTLSRKTIDADARHYMRLGGSGVFATRIRGFRSMGDYPDFLYMGGNSEMRGYDYLQFVGQKSVFANAELRFPIIEAALTPIGVVGGVRGVFFANVGGAWFDGQPTGDPCGSGNFKFASSGTELCYPITGYTQDPITGLAKPSVSGTPTAVSGFRLQDGRASYGLGLETFALGFPIHFDWSWRTTFNKDYEDVVFGCTSVASNGQCVNTAPDWRKPRFAVWIGYDF